MLSRIRSRGFTPFRRVESTRPSRKSEPPLQLATLKQSGERFHSFLDATAPRAFEKLIAASDREAMRELVHTMAAAALPFEFNGVASFIRALNAESRRALFDAAVTHLDAHEFAAFTRLIGYGGLYLLAAGDRRIEPTILSERFGANVTTRVDQLYRTGAKNRPAGAAGCVFLFGRGLFGNQVPGYFDVNRRAVAAWMGDKKSSRMLRYDTAADSMSNARLIRDQVEHEAIRGKKVVLIGHSKFGLDLRRAFAAYPTLKNKVAGVLLFQPVSTAMVMNKICNLPVGPAASGAAKKIFGSSGAVDDLGDAGALPFGPHPERWPGKEVPTVIIASASDGKSLLRPFVQELREEGISSDGALGLAEQIGFDGASIAVLPEPADHFQLVTRAASMLGAKVDPRALTRAALTVLFERIEEMKHEATLPIARSPQAHKTSGKPSQRKLL